MRWLATGGYSGYAPVAPGTCGSLVGLGLFLLLASLPVLLYGVMLVGVIGLGIWTAGEAERLFGRQDDAAIVIDEIAGMLVMYYSIPVSFWPLVIGFGCFRLFDIYKPWPQLERLPGGWGVMLDDLWAGVLANGCIRVFLWSV